MSTRPQSSSSWAIGPSKMEDLVIHWMIFVVGLIPVAIAAWRGETWGVQPSVGLLMVLFAARSVLVHHREQAQAREQHCIDQSEPEES